MRKWNSSLWSKVVKKRRSKRNDQSTNNYNLKNYGYQKDKTLTFFTLKTIFDFAFKI